MAIATIIAADKIETGAIAALSGSIAATGASNLRVAAIDERAVDIHFAGDHVPVRAALTEYIGHYDFAVQSDADRVKTLLISDMDSTMIRNECIDEMAAWAGVAEQIVPITEAAMQGELDFVQALHARVALLKGLPESACAAILTERIKMMPGAQTAIGTMRHMGVATLLVSGGFTFFADRIAAQIGFDRAYANVLEWEQAPGGEEGASEPRLSGALIGAIVDGQRKSALLLEHCRALGIAPAQSIAVGDGANDIPMLRAAGLGVAFHAKAAAQAAADAIISVGDLTSLLYFQGIAPETWVRP
jgi:phosphoserine phosphatase